MNKPTPPTPEDLILAMLRDVLARQAEQMGLAPEKTETAQPKVEAAPSLPEPQVIAPPLNFIEPKIETAAPEVAPVPEIKTPEPPALPPEVEQRLAAATFTSILRAEREEKKTEPPAAPEVVLVPETKTSEPPKPEVEQRLAAATFTSLLRTEREENKTEPPAARLLFAPLSKLEDTQPTRRVEQTATVREEEVPPLSESEWKLNAEINELAARPFVPSGFPQILRVFLLMVFALVAFLNLPLAGGTAIIRVLTDPKPVALSDGLLIRAEGAPAVYLIEQGRRRLISSSEAFQHYGYRWGDVREVPRDFLRTIPEGTPVHVLVRCVDKPEIYLLEGLEKRWVRNVGALEPLGYDINRDMRWVTCARLRSMFDGLPLP